MSYESNDRSYDGSSDVNSRSRLKRRRHRKHKKDKKNKSPSPNQKRFNKTFADDFDVNEASVDSQAEQAMRVAQSIKGRNDFNRSLPKHEKYGGGSMLKDTTITGSSRDKLQGSIAAIFGGASYTKKQF